MFGGLFTLLFNSLFGVVIQSILGLFGTAQ